MHEPTVYILLQGSKVGKKLVTQIFVACQALTQTSQTCFRSAMFCQLTRYATSYTLEVGHLQMLVERVPRAVVSSVALSLGQGKALRNEQGSEQPAPPGHSPARPRVHFGKSPSVIVTSASTAPAIACLPAKRVESFLPSGSQRPVVSLQITSAR